MAKLKSKLKAATLMESLIAMVIIVVCMGVSSIIYSNVIESRNYYLKFKATQLLNTEAELTKNTKSFLDTEKKIGEWSIQQKMEPYALSNNLFMLSLTAISTNNKTTVVRKELVQIDE